MNALDILINARCLLSDPEKWTKEVAARNAEGEEVHAWDGDAVCWCALGALGKVVNGRISTKTYHESHVALRRAIPNKGFNGHIFVGPYNDTSEHADVLTLFDKAIANLRNNA